MTSLLLVTGSRSLARLPGAEPWARALIREALRNAELLVVGDASGPDAWALDEQVSVRSEALRYELSGLVTHVVCGSAWAAGTSGWRPTGRYAGTPVGSRRWPLARNAEMVAASARLLTSERRGVCLAFIDAASLTRGAAHTARLAGEAGFEVKRYVWGGGGR